MPDTNEPYWNRMVPELTVTDLPASLSSIPMCLASAL